MVSTAPLMMVVGVVVVTTLAIRWRGDVVKTYFFQPIDNGRTLGAAALGLLLVAVWLQSGTPWKVLTSLLIIAFAVAYVAFEKPHRDIK
jgi:hypothetical protein